MNKEDSEAFSEANSMGEERCGNCESSKLNGYYVCINTESPYYGNRVDVDDSCFYFTPTRGSELGKDFRIKDDKT